MIILAQPMYSRRELNQDSTYVICSSLLSAVLRQRDDIYFVVPFPDKHSGYRYVPDGFFNHPNITRVPQRVSPRKMANAISYDAGWYDKLFREFGFDVVWCNLTEIAGHLRGAGTGVFEPVGRPSTVAAHNYIIHRSLPYPLIEYEAILLQQLHGALLADVNVFNSEHCRDMLMENARTYLHEDQVARIDSSSVEIPMGTLTDIEPPKRKRNEVPLIAYNHRLQEYKKYRETFDLLAKLWDEGIRFEVRLFSKQNYGKLSKYPFIVPRFGIAKHADYLKELALCDLNITNSVHETFCIAAVESMALGQPLIAPDGVTFPQITGRDALSYPFLFKTAAEQEKMVRNLLSDHELRRKWGKRLSEYVRREFSSDLWATRYIDLWESSVKDRVPKSRDTVLSMVRKRLADNSGCTMMELFRAIHGSVVDGVTPFSSQSCSPPKLIRLVRHVGGRVVIERGKQRCYAA